MYIHIYLYWFVWLNTHVNSTFVAVAKYFSIFYVCSVWVRSAATLYDCSCGSAPVKLRLVNLLLQVSIYPHYTIRIHICMLFIYMKVFLLEISFPRLVFALMGQHPSKLCACSCGSASLQILYLFVGTMGLESRS